MRIVLPFKLVIWALVGALLLLFSLILIAAGSGDDAQAFNIILLAFALWVASGVEAMIRFDGIWLPPWRRLSFAVAAGLPLLLVVAAFSMFGPNESGGSMQVRTVQAESKRADTSAPNSTQALLRLR